MIEIITISSPIITGLTTNVGDYTFGIIKADSSTSIYKISQKEDLYQFDAGTYYLVVYSADGAYSTTTSYHIMLQVTRKLPKKQIVKKIVQTQKKAV